MRMINAGCVLEAHHRIPECEAIDDLGTPGGMQKLLEWGELYNSAQIVSVRLREEQAERIRERLWPTETLLGATCGRGFSVETEEQVAIINEILKPEIFIKFSHEHVWMLQTWPEVSK